MFMNVTNGIDNIIFLAFCLIAVVSLSKNLFKNLISYRKPPTSIEVKVVKIYDKYSGRFYFARGSGGLNLSPRYHITFRFKNGKEEVFICPLPSISGLNLEMKEFWPIKEFVSSALRKTIYRNEYSQLLKKWRDLNV